MSEHLAVLGIPNLKVTARFDHNDRVEFEAETIQQTYHCCLAQRLGKWTAGPRRMVNDTPHGGFPVLIRLNNLLTSKVEHLKLIDGRYRTVSHEAGLSTIRVDWDEAA